MSLTVLATLIEKTINKALQYDPASFQSLHDLNRTRLSIISTSPVLNLHIEVLNQYFHVSENQDYKNESTHNNNEQYQAVTLTGSLASLAQLANSDPYNLSDSGVEVSGRIHTLMAYQNFFKQLDIDWEEGLIDHFQSIFGHTAGITIGHQFAAFLSISINWGVNQKNNFEKYFSDYLSEELSVIPNAYEIEEYLNSVDQIRSKVDRIKARVDKLKKSLT